MKKGRHLPDADRLGKLADYFSVTTDYLLGRSAANLPADVYDVPLLEGMKAGEVLRLIQELSPEQRGALYVLLRDMRLSTVVGRYSQKGNISKKNEKLVAFSAESRLYR